METTRKNDMEYCIKKTFDLIFSHMYMVIGPHHVCVFTCFCLLSYKIVKL